METLAGSEGPKRITMCTGTDDNSKNLGGFQLFYGLFNPQAGPAHGDITGKCQEYPLYGKVIQINVWIWAPEEYAGMEIIMTDYTDASSAPKSITAGVTGDLTAAKRETYNFGNSNDDHFFGFETQMKSDDRITEISFAKYDRDEYLKCKSEDEATARTGLGDDDWYTE